MGLKRDRIPPFYRNRHDLEDFAGMNFPEIRFRLPGGSSLADRLRRTFYRRVIRSASNSKRARRRSCSVIIWASFLKPTSGIQFN
jgi:hypothetical protein